MTDKIEMERRFLTNQIRSSDKLGEEEIFGYAAVFDSYSQDLGGFIEVIQYGAFRETLKDDILGTVNHDPHYVLGRTKSGTLEVNEDAKGLAFRVWPPNTQWAKDLITSIKRGDISGASFAFQTILDDWSIENGKTVRRLIQVKLHDVSVATYPAYPGAGAQARHLQTGSQAGRVLVSNQARRRVLEILEKGKP